MTAPYCGYSGGLDTLLIDGEDLASYCDVLEDISGAYVTPQVRGEHLRLPGRDGAISLDLPFESGLVSYGMTLKGADQSTFNDRYRALRRLVRPSKDLALTRVVNVGGTVENHIATGRYLSGLEPEVTWLRYGRLTLTLAVLDGLWHSATLLTPAVTNGQVLVVPGDERTHRLTMTVSGACTVTNQTSGFAFTVGAACTVDNRAFTSGAASLSWTKRYPMRLLPGNNTFAVTNAQTVTFSYRPAYL